MERLYHFQILVAPRRSSFIEGVVFVTTMSCQLLNFISSRAHAGLRFQLSNMIFRPFYLLQIATLQQ